NLYEIQSIYENGFNKLTDRYFNKTPWPEAEFIAPLVSGDQVFLILYKELYYRHIYNKLKIWNIHSVLNVLYSLVEKSRINYQLEMYNTNGNPDEVSGEFGIHPLYKMLGYFSLIGLLRLHSLLGDYFQAIKVLSNVELTRNTMYSRIPACQITTYYYVGFAYLMMRRYQEPFNLQLKVFMNEVAQQSMIPVIRSYLKLYTTMPIAKLAAFLDMMARNLQAL
ncbi:predicted protein, partial [Nematostella vectensis]